MDNNKKYWLALGGLYFGIILGTFNVVLIWYIGFSGNGLLVWLHGFIIFLLYVIAAVCGVAHVHYKENRFKENYQKQAYGALGAAGQDMMDKQEQAKLPAELDVKISSVNFEVLQKIEVASVKISKAGLKPSDKLRFHLEDDYGQFVRGVVSEKMASVNSEFDIDLSERALPAYGYKVKIATN